MGTLIRPCGPSRIYRRLPPTFCRLHILVKCTEKFVQIRYYKFKKIDNILGIFFFGMKPIAEEIWEIHTYMEIEQCMLEHLLSRRIN